MEVHALADVVRRSLERSPSWFLLLGFLATDDEVEDWSQMSQALPWLAEIGRERGTLCQDLRRHGLGVVACADAAEARRLFRAIRGCKLSVEVLRRVV